MSFQRERKLNLALGEEGGSNLVTLPPPKKSQLKVINHYQYQLRIHWRFNNTSNQREKSGYLPIWALQPGIGRKIKLFLHYKLDNKWQGRQGRKGYNLSINDDLQPVRMEDATDVHVELVELVDGLCRADIPQDTII